MALIRRYPPRLPRCPAVAGTARRTVLRFGHDGHGTTGLDSVAAMDLIMEIEDKFGIDIPMNLVADLRNVQDLLDVIRQQTKGR
jgi:hypothetical protein